jgi:hypothetical protein
MSAVALLAIAERACELQDRAEAVLARAASPARRDAALAQEGGHLAGEYHRLAAWVRDAVVEPGPDPTGAARRQELAQLLGYHCQVLHDGIRLAFPRHVGPGTEDRLTRHISADLGRPGRRLRELTDELRGST